MRSLTLSMLAGACLMLGATTASAETVRLTDQQLDQVSAGVLANASNLFNNAAVIAAGELFIAFDLADDETVNFSPLQDPNVAPVAIPAFLIGTQQVSVFSFLSLGFNN